MGGSEDATEAEAAAPAANLTADGAKAAIKTVADVLSKLTAEEKKETPSAAVTPPEVAAGLSEQAVHAVERFRSTTRWMLGAYAGLGALLFGSIPFANVTEASGSDLGWIVVGLLMAAIGVSFAIVAVSQVNEPEDASLGELVDDFEHRAAFPAGYREKAIERLHRILSGTDGPNHLGPQFPEDAAPELAAADGTPADPPIPGHALIRSIGRAQGARYTAAASLAGAEKAHAAKVAARDGALARVEKLQAQLESTLKAIKELQLDCTGNDDEHPLCVRAAELKEALAGAVVKWDEQCDEVDEAADALVDDAKTVAEMDARLAVHLQHRDLVITESGVAQVQATFRAARHLLVVGALFVAAGATIYAVALPGAGSDEPEDESSTVMTFAAGVEKPEDGSTAVTIEIHGLEGAQASCAGGSLAAHLVGEVGATSTVIVEDEDRSECDGRWILPAGTWTLGPTDP